MFDKIADIYFKKIKLRRRLLVLICSYLYKSLFLSWTLSTTSRTEIRSFSNCFNEKNKYI
jgi:hypothetical protein